MNSFTGVWVTFQSVEALSAAIHALRAKRIEPVVIHAPFNISGKHPPGNSPTPNLSQFALAGAVSGTFGSLLLMVTMSLEWIQPLSAKPIVSLLTMVPLAFELSIFSAVLFILLGLVVVSATKKNQTNLPTSQDYKGYSRFTRDRFGLVVACDASGISELKDLFSELQAEEVFIEK
jgi:hypothetical protein